MTLNATGGNFTSGANHTIRLSTGETVSAAGAGTSSLTFYIPVTDALLGAGNVSIVEIW